MNDLSQKRELANEARDIYESPAFKLALQRAKDFYLAELINTTAGSERQLAIVAELRALDRVVGELKAVPNDFTMAVRRHG